MAIPCLLARGMERGGVVLDFQVPGRIPTVFSVPIVFASTYSAGSGNGGAVAVFSKVVGLELKRPRTAEFRSLS